MNHFIEELLNRPRPQKIGILTGAILLLLIVSYFYVYLPGVDQLTKLTDQIAAVRSEYDRKKVTVATLPKLQSDFKELNLKLKAAAAQLPDSKEIPDLLTNLSTTAREAGLEIISFRPRPENYQDFYAEIPVDIVVRGGFHGAVSFFDAVGKSNRPVNIDNINLKNSKARGDQVELEISTVATTYRFLDDAERKKVAEEKAKAQAKK